MKSLTYTLIACLLTVSFGFAQVDNRVKSKLNRLKINYDQLKNGNFTINYRFTDTKRKQRIYISSKISKFGGLEVREIYSLIWESKVPIPDNMLNQLLAYNGEVKLGTWKLEKTSSGEDILYFSVKIDANANLELFKDALTIVHKVADKWEKKLFNKDDF